MANVRRSTSSSKVVNKRQPDAPKVRSARQPSTLQEMGDTNFGTLDSSKDGLFVTYNNDTSLFELLSADDLLAKAVEDNDIADQFIDVLEDEIDLGAVVIDNIDGGAF